jgi:DNA polymerase-3 subunit delta
MDKPPPTVYLVYGDDGQALDEFLAQMRVKLGNPATADLNTTRLDPKGLTLADLRAVCFTAPFLARRRLVILEGYLESLSAHGGGKPPPADIHPKKTPDREDPSDRQGALHEFLAFLEEVPPATALVLMEKRSIQPGNAVLKWASTHEGIAYVREFAPPRGAALPQWILQRAQSAGGRFTPQAAQLLAEVAGDDPRVLAQEILKLLTYAKFSRPVTPEDIRALTPESSQTNIFDMVDAIGGRDGNRALRLLRKSVEQESAPAVFGMVVRQFRLLIKTREALDGGTPPGKLASVIGEHPYVARKLVGQAGGFSLPVLEGIYHRLRDADEEVKIGRMELDAALETLVVEISK